MRFQLAFAGGRGSTSTQANVGHPPMPVIAARTGPPEDEGMSTLTISVIVFACVLGGALLGMYLGRVLPKHHLSDDAKDVIKVSMAMVATLAALVLGLLTASAKSSLDDKESKLRDAAAQIILLDHTMALYGAETREPRDLLKRLVAARVNQIWPEEDAGEVAPR